MRAYVTNAVSHRPEYGSRYVYAELIDPVGRITQRVRMRQNDTIGTQGYFELSDTLIAGSYTLRAYTRYMENNGEAYFFKKRIHVLNTLGKSIQVKPEWGEKGKVKFTLTDPTSNSSPTVRNVKLFMGKDELVSSYKNGIVNADVSFFTPNNKYVLLNACNYKEYIPIPFSAEYSVSFLPEGGNLVAGELCKVAFKALSEDGSGCDISGEVKDEQDITVTNFESLHNGMGTFSFIPMVGKQYKAVCKNSGNKVKVFNLPIAATSSVALKIDSRKDILFLNILHASVSAVDSVWIIAHQGGVPYYTRLCALNETISFKKNNFNAGIVHFMIATRDLDVISERLVFIYPIEEVVGQVLSDKECYKSREKIKLSLDLKDKNGNPLNATCSLAVTSNADVIPDSCVSIFSTLLLSSDLQGYVEMPHWYFNKGSEKLKAEAVDVLMLTQGWRRYDMAKAIKGMYAVPTIRPETSMELSGRVVSYILRKRVAHTKVGVSVPQFMVVEQVETDENGYFRFNNFEFPDTTKYLISALSRKAKDNVELRIDKDNFPSVDYYLPLDYKKRLNASATSTYLERADMQLFYEKGIRNKWLDEVLVTAPRRVYKTISERSADVVVREDKLKTRNNYSLSEAIGPLNIPGLFYSDGNLVFRGSKVFLFLNGILVEKENVRFILESLMVLNIQQLDFSRSEFIPGIYKAAPILYITLKSGNDISRNYSPSNISVLKLLGYQQPVEFYSPQYDKIGNAKPDLRTTVYWNPDIKIKNGKADVNFYSADGKVDYSVIIEGLTDEGKLIRMQKVIP